MFTTLSILFSFLTVISGCEDISGIWRNDLGSEVDINHLDHGKLVGKYYRNDGGKQQVYDLVGALPYNKPGASFAFIVSQGNGESTTVWTGQCQVCGGKQILETTWLTRSYVESCDDKWKSTRIGKDIFHRTNKTLLRERKAIRDHGQDVTKRAINEGGPTTNKQVTEKCILEGVWYNDIGSEMILNRTADSNIIVGEYRTAVERVQGAAGSTHSLIYGSGVRDNPNSTFSLIVVWREGKSVTGWLGQCHICGVNNTAILEMNWLLRSQVEKCEDVWKSTMFGVNTFTRHEQKDGPRKSEGIDTPNREGEDDGRTGTSSKTASNIFYIISLYFLKMFI